MEKPNWNLKKLSEKDSWVIEKIDGYYCQLCINFKADNREGTWTRKPCVNKTAMEAIRKHRSSREHIQSENLKQQSGPMEKIQETLNDCLVEGMVKRFRQIFFICTNELPLSLFDSLYELETMNQAFTPAEIAAFSSSEKASISPIVLLMMLLKHSPQ
eukprot:Pompholyxophrys_sp_v1_NODE_206_length_1191_cov_2.220951.p1 type:complete len:158 gc:universal NODE_206_length_1191_cov_2.220951:239-712(+)